MMRLYKWQRRRWFWKIRYFIRSIVFAVGKFLFVQRERARHTKEGLSIAGQISRSIVPYVFLSILIVAALEIGENNLASATIAKPILARHALEWLVSLRDNISQSVQSLTVLFSITASVSGIFLGLYFTAISVVAGSVFARVPGNLRELLLNEKVGNHYIKVLAVLTSISVILLGYGAYGGTPGALNTFLVILLGCFGIFGFLKLGTRAFHFFDPASLSDSLFYELRNNVRQASANGFRWQDPNFQAHYQKLAEKNVGALKSLVRYCTQDSRMEPGPLTTVMLNAAGFLAYYARQRSAIPSDSRWYALAPRYKSFFFQDSSQLTLALKTNTPVQPQMVPDRYWLEDRITDELSYSIEKAIKTQNMGVVYSFLDVLKMQMGILGANLEIEKGYDIVRRLSEPIEQYFDSSSFNEKACTETDLGVFDYYGLSTMSLILGFCKAVDDSGLQAMMREASKPSSFARSIYRNRVPPALLSRVEHVRKRLHFEKTVEKRIISPAWYVRHLVLTGCLDLLKEAAEKSVSLLDDFYAKKSEKLLTNRCPVLASTHCLRGLEMCKKLDVHFQTLKALVDEFERDAACKDLPPPTWNWDQLKRAIDDAHHKLMTVLAGSMAGLASFDRKESVPDQFGRAYSTVCQDCFDALADKRPDRFAALFPFLFDASLRAYEKLGKQTQELQPTSALILTLEPLLDIQSLSGYAKIYSELHHSSIAWDSCKSTWERYLENNEKPQEVVKYLVNTYQVRTGLFQLSPRDVLRTEWELRFHTELRQLNLIDKNNGPWGEYPEVKHESPLIRALCKGGFEPHIPPIEVFFTTYLMRRPESEGVAFKDRWRLGEKLSEQQDREAEE